MLPHRSARLQAIWLLAAISCAGTLSVQQALAQEDPTAQAAPLRPNFVFFLTDDQRNDTLGCAGHEIIKTPTIDGLAARGVRFENMFVSHSICWVSRASILTGMTARSFASPEEPDRVTEESMAGFYPRLLHEAGYRTAHYGKFHTRLPRGTKLDESYDEIEIIHLNPYFKKQPDGSLRHETEVLADRGVAFLKSQPKEQPFALNLWFNAGHAEDGDHRPGIGHFPWPKAVDGMYENVEVPAPRLGDPAIFESQPDFLKESINRKRWFWRWDTPEKYQINIRAYFRMISGIDQAMARVLKTLEEEGFADNTIVIYSADNGYYMGDRGFAGKWSHYEQSLRVPLIIMDPRPSADAGRGRVEERYAMNIDLPATFLSWAGVDIPRIYDGMDLSATVRGKGSRVWRSDMFFEHVTLRPNLSWEGARNERYKYARYFDQAKDAEFLHDLAKDPDELVNLATDPSYAEGLAEMRILTDQYIARYGAPIPGSLYAPKKD
jgi:choline-sulfatase